MDSLRPMIVNCFHYTIICYGVSRFSDKSVWPLFSLSRNLGFKGNVNEGEYSVFMKCNACIKKSICCFGIYVFILDNFFSSKLSMVWAVAQEIRHSIIHEIISIIIIVDSVVFFLLSQCRLFHQGVAEIGSVAQTLTMNVAVFNLLQTFVCLVGKSSVRVLRMPKSGSCTVI